MTPIYQIALENITTNIPTYQEIDAELLCRHIQLSERLLLCVLLTECHCSKT